MTELLICGSPNSCVEYDETWSLNFIQFSRFTKKIFVCDTSGDVNFSQWPWRIGMGIFGTGRFCLTKSLRNPGCQWRYCLQNVASGNSLAIQWSGPHTSTARGTGSIPGQENKIPHAVWRGQKIKINCFTKMWLTSEIHLSLHWRLGDRDHRGRTEALMG